MGQAEERKVRMELPALLLPPTPQRPRGVQRWTRTPNPDPATHILKTHTCTHLVFSRSWCAHHRLTTNCTIMTMTKRIRMRMAMTMAGALQADSDFWWDDDRNGSPCGEGL
eukprot:3932038-Rhodomonas_salina.1